MSIAQISPVSDAHFLCKILEMKDLENLTVRKYTRMMGLEPGFTSDDLRKAYLCGCRKLAPDKGGDHRQFTVLQTANSVLKPYARRKEVEIEKAVRSRADPRTLASDPSKGQRHKSANSAYMAMYGDKGPALRGHGDWLKQDVPPELRPPDSVSMSRLHETFEKLSTARGNGPTTVSTHVVQPIAAYSTIGHDINDAEDDFTIGALADLQRAYGGAMS